MTEQAESKAATKHDLMRAVMANVRSEVTLAVQARNGEGDGKQWERDDFEFAMAETDRRLEAFGFPEGVMATFLSDAFNAENVLDALDKYEREPGLRAAVSIAVMLKEAGINAEIIEL